MKWITLIFVWLACAAVAVFALHEKAAGTGWYVIGAAAAAIVATWTIADADKYGES